MRRSSIAVGIILILVGLFFLLLPLFPNLSNLVNIEQHWPLIIVAVGGLFILGALLALFVLSAADAVSVFIRATIVPLATPEEMRGRVLAVENIFIGGSNELGGLESGLTAAWLGLAPAVVIGGLGTLIVVALWSQLFHSLLLQPMPVLQVWGIWE